MDKRAGGVGDQAAAIASQDDAELELVVAEPGRAVTVDAHRGDADHVGTAKVASDNRLGSGRGRGEGRFDTERLAVNRSRVPRMQRLLLDQVDVRAWCEQD